MILNVGRLSHACGAEKIVRFDYYGWKKSKHIRRNGASSLMLCLQLPINTIKSADYMFLLFTMYFLNVLLLINGNLTSLSTDQAKKQQNKEKKTYTRVVRNIHYLTSIEGSVDLECLKSKESLNLYIQ